MANRNSASWLLKSLSLGEPEPRFCPQQQAVILKYHYKAIALTFLVL